MHLTASPKLFLAMVLGLMSSPAFAGETIAEPKPTYLWKASPQQQQPQQPTEKQKSPAENMLQLLQQMGNGGGGSGAKGLKKEQDEISQDYQNANNPGGRYDNFKAVDFADIPAGRLPFEQTAKECGEEAQRQCSPSKRGGRTMCGEAVKMAVKCMSKVLVGNNCDSQCGHGKMWVNCGKLKGCGYEKVDPSSAKCQMPGAILAYSQSPTTRGQKYGHVEFVCGRGKYCSVYKAPQDKPWPKFPADACYFPAKLVHEG